MTKQLICEQCGRSFEKHWRGTRLRRFCGVACRNRYVSQHYWTPDKPRKLKTCPQCGHVGLRAQALCTRCGGVPRPVGNLKWTAEQETYLREHYPTDGAAAVSAVLGYSVSSVTSKARKLGIQLTDEARCHLIHGAAQTYMSKANPMRRAEVRAKVRAWREAHPDEVAAVNAKLLAGHRLLQRDKPSKLERLLRDLLTEFGVSFEPSALIKERFVVDIRIGTLIVQADGDYWHGHPRFEPLTERQAAQQRRDRAQDAYLRTCGYTVVRIWESDMTRDKVAAILREHGLIPAA